MSMQEFSLQLEQKNEPPLLLQILQALRTCEPDQLRAAMDEVGWNPWPNGTAE